MHFFPNHAIFLQIGENIDIRWYAVLILSGALLVYFIGAKNLKKAGYDSEVIDDLFIGVLAFGIAGARLWYCTFYDFAGYFSNPFSLIEIWDGGLAIQGGIFAAALYAAIYCKINHYNFFHLGDMIFPYVLLAQAIGRWGNFANREAFGNVVKESYFDNPILSLIKDGMYIQGAYRQPMFFYESILCILGFILIMLFLKTSKPHRGDGVFCYLSWYGVIRLWIESQRTDALMLGNIRMAQLISVIFMIIGLSGLLGAFRKLINKDKPLVIFDLDGTLLDTKNVIYASFELVFGKYAPELTFTPDQKAGWMGPTLEQTFQKYTPEADTAAEVAMYREFNMAHQTDMVKPFEHVVEVLDWLKENGYQMVIASSKKRDVIELGLQANNMMDYFEDIIGKESVENPKPDKEVIVKAYKAVGRGLDNAIYVGDANTDVQAAKNAGVFSIAFASEPLKREELVNEKPNRLIDDFAQLKDILQEEGHSWTSNMM